MVQRTPGPFDYYQEIHGGVNGDTIRADAEDPALNAKTIAALASELEGDAKKVPGQLSGDITATVQKNPQDVSKNAQGLAAKGFFAVGLINLFAKDVDTFDTSVDTLNSSFATQVRTREQSPKYDDSAKMTSDIKSAVKRALNGQYQTAVNKLDTDADSIATKFKSPPSKLNDYVKQLMRAGLIPLSAAVLYPGLKLSISDKQQYYKNFLGAMTPEEQKQWIKTHNSELPPQAGKYVDPSVQQYFAHLVAEKIKAPGTIDRDTANLMMFLSTGPAFSQKLYQEVSPREMASEIEDFNNDVFPTPGGGKGIDNDKLGIYKDFINAAGVSLATYSNQHGQYAPPAGPNGQTGQQKLALDWYNAITDDDHKQDASALTLLIRSGGHYAGYDSTFMGNLTGNVYKWERDQDGAVWGPRDGDTMWDPNHPPTMHSQYGGYETGQSYSYTGGVKATDGLANLLGGMEHSPQAAKDFFMGHYDTLDGKAPDSLQDKMDYLVGGGDGRTWDASDNSDEGDGLGKALAAATVGEDKRTTEGTSIANSLFHNIAQYGGDDDNWHDNKWHLNPGMTDSIGQIASGYTGDIYDQLDGDGMSHGSLHLDLGDDPDGVLNDVLGELGRPDDKTGLQTLTASMLLEGKGRIGSQLDALSDHDLASLDDAGLGGVQERNGRVMGMLLNEGLHLSQNQDDVADQRAAIMSKAIDLTAGFLPGGGTVLGEGAHEVSKAAFDTLKGEAIEQLKNSAANSPVTDDYLNGQALSLDHKIQYNAIDSIVEHGFLNKQHVDGFAQDFPGLPDSVLTADGKHIDPRLYAGDKIDTSNMSTTEKASVQKMQNDWHDLNDSQDNPQYAPFNNVLGATQSGEFMKYFEDPTLQYSK